MAILPAYSYIDGVEIDDLWMRLKRDGVPTERLNKATAEVSGKVSLGLGKLIDWLVGDLKGEVGGKVAGEETVKTAYTAPIRLLLVQELLPSVKRIKLEQHDAVAELRANEFVEVDCPALSVALLPRFGDFQHITLANELVDERSGHADLTPKDRVDLLMKHVERFSAQSPAFSFWVRLLSEDTGALARFSKRYPNALMNQMSICRDDLIVGASLALRRQPADKSPVPISESEKRAAYYRKVSAESSEAADDRLDEVLAGLSEATKERLPFVGERQSKQEERKRKKAEEEEKRKAEEEKRKADLRANCDTLMVAYFEDGDRKMKRNVAAQSPTGRACLFGRVLSNELEDDEDDADGGRTRMITVQPITLSVG